MAQKKKKPKVVLKKNKVIVLAVAIVALCICMLAVVTLTAPASGMYFSTTVQKSKSTILSSENPFPEDASQETAQQTVDAGVAQVIARLEEAEKQTREGEQRAKETETGVSKVQSHGDHAQNWIAEVQNQATQQKVASNVSSLGSSSSANVALGSKDSTPSSSPEKTSSTTGSSSSPRPVVRKDYTIPPARSGATLVFVFDDGGQNLSDLQHYLNLPFPVDVAVLPQLQHSVESARRVRSSGRHELLLHQPMQARNLSINPGPGAITPSMTTTDIDAVVRKNLAEIGPVSGLNNHEGSLITESQIKVGKVIEICQQQGIFFLDSRTSANTAAPQAALELGVKIWERDVFLDNTQHRADILEQIQRGLEMANRKGYAIYIGHVWSGSNLAQILQELYPVLKSQGYTFSTVGGLYENFGD
jgi:polysaccharide deacetylase 2 family uncharacterized protein YibQ